MKQIRNKYKYPVLAGGLLLALAACDTTEDLFYPGAESDILLSVVQTGDIRLSADGAPQDVDVESTASWDASIQQELNIFNVTQSTQKGNGKVTLSGTLNYGESEREATLLLSVRNVNKELRIPIRQAALRFKVNDYAGGIIPGEGDTLTFDVDSSIAWKFEVISENDPSKKAPMMKEGESTEGEGEGSGDNNGENPGEGSGDNNGENPGEGSGENSGENPGEGSGENPGDNPTEGTEGVSWLKFDPGISGQGSWSERKVTVIVLPNYTESDRSVTLALRPEDPNALEALGSAGLLPGEFTIEQTTPGNWVTTLDAILGVPTYSSCDVTVSYESLAPVSEVGVHLLDKDGKEAGSFKATPGEEGFPLIGRYKLSLTDLLPGTTYMAYPYVVCEAGRAERNPAEFITQSADDLIQNISVRTEAEYNSATVTINYLSYVELSEVGVTLKDPDGKTQNLKAVMESGAYPMRGPVVMMLNDLKPGSLYTVSPYAVCAAGKVLGQGVDFYTKDANDMVSDVNISNSETSYNTCTLTIDYDSQVKVSEVGVTLTDMNNASAEPQRLKAVMENDVYPQRGPIVMTLTDLQAGSRYKVVPYVECEAGTIDGQGVTFTTQTASDIVSDLSVTQTDPTYNSCTVTINYNSGAVVTEVGVEMTKPSGDTERLKAVMADGTYPQRGPVVMTITGLETATTYKLAPYLDCEAGTVSGPTSNFTTQTASDVVTDISVSTDPSYRECSLTIEYTSPIDVSDVGVTLTNSAGVEIGTYHADKIDGAYPKAGEVKLKLTGLETNTRYRVRPFVTCAAGTANGSTSNFTTRKEEGVSIRNFTINPGAKSVSVTVNISSDCAVTEGGMTIYDAYGNEIVTYTNPLSADATQFTVTSTDCLNPKTEYMVKVFAFTAINDSAAGPDYFTTKGLTPGSGDNNPVD